MSPVVECIGIHLLIIPSLLSNAYKIFHDIYFFLILIIWVAYHFMDLAKSFSNKTNFFKLILIQLTYSGFTFIVSHFCLCCLYTWDKIIFLKGPWYYSCVHVIEASIKCRHVDVRHLQTEACCILIYHPCSACTCSLGFHRTLILSLPIMKGNWMTAILSERWLLENQSMLMRLWLNKH